MPKVKKNSNGIERVTVKLPKSIAAYFRKTFPHGKRSEFVARCIEDYQKEQEIKSIEDELRAIRRVK